MDGMASDGAYNTRAVMVQFQALFRGKFLDARAGGRVYIRPIHRWLSRKQVKSPKKWPGKSSQICFLFELLRYTGQHDLEIDDFLKKYRMPVVMTHTFCILECFDPSAHEQLLHRTMECKR